MEYRQGVYTSCMIYMVYIAILNNSCYPVLQWIWGCKKKTPLLTSSKVSVWSSSVAWHRQNRHDCLSMDTNLEIFLSPSSFLNLKKEKGQKNLLCTSDQLLGVWGFSPLNYISGRMCCCEPGNTVGSQSLLTDFLFFFSFLSSKLKLNQGSNHLSRGQYAATFISAP